MNDENKKLNKIDASFMLKSIKLNNYRSFKETTIFFKETTILSGKNNSGKSTIIEALRLVSYTLKKSSTGKFLKAHSSFKNETLSKGLFINPALFKIDLNFITNYYSPEVSSIEATFSDDVKIIVYISEDCIFGTLLDKNEKYIESNEEAKVVFFQTCNILPQVSPLKDSERLLKEDSVISKEDTYLHSLHFRNDLFINEKEFFDDFKKIISIEMPNLEIETINIDELRENYLTLNISENRLPSEVNALGSGMQMWIQIIWFITKTRFSDIIILDEPDVYMHPDLQIKLYYLLKKYYKQIIIATHSVEIISLVEPSEIVPINNKLEYNKSLSTYEYVQSFINGLGSVHNLSLLRLNYCNKILFIEGDDIKLLKKLYYKKDSELKMFNEIIDYKLGGSGNFQNSIAVTNFIKTQTMNVFNCYCILDNDFNTSKSRDDKYAKAKKTDLNLHIWKKKEVENYLLIPKVIFRLTKRQDSDYFDFHKKLEKLISSEKQYVLNLYKEEFRKGNSLLKNYDADKEVNKFFKKNWISMESKLALISGKKFISKINKMMSKEYGVHCSINEIINEIKYDELDDEMKNLFKALEGKEVNI